VARAMVRLVLAAAMLSITSVAFGSEHAWAKGAPECLGYLGSKTCTGSGSGGIGVGVGKGGRHHGPGGGDSGPQYDYVYVMTCFGNGPDGPNNPCGVAITSCGVPNQYRYWVYRRLVDASGRPIGPWEQLPNAVCRSIATTLQDIAAAFRWRFVPIAASHANFDPADGTLVNVDTIFYADTASTMRMTITLLGEQVALTLHPTRWDWRFGDGSTMSTTTPGAPYPDTSVTHRYRSTGTYAASVTVTWDGTFAFGGEAADIPGDTSRAGPAATVTVKEAHSHLVDG
jgi:hypothetical protein